MLASNNESVSQRHNGNTTRVMGLGLAFLCLQWSSMMDGAAEPQSAVVFSLLALLGGEQTVEESGSAKAPRETQG
ncbi:unnamed protein product [Gadus morhua 'NCC']